MKKKLLILGALVVVAGIVIVRAGYPKTTPEPVNTASTSTVASATGTVVPLSDTDIATSTGSRPGFIRFENKKYGVVFEYPDKYSLRTGQSLFYADGRVNFLATSSAVENVADWGEVDIAPRIENLRDAERAFKSSSKQYWKRGLRFYEYVARYEGDDNRNVVNVWRLDEKQAVYCESISDLCVAIIASVEFK